MAQVEVEPLWRFPPRPSVCTTGKRKHKSQMMLPSQVSMRATVFVLGAALHDPEVE